MVICVCSSVHALKKTLNHKLKMQMILKNYFSLHTFVPSQDIYLKYMVKEEKKEVNLIKLNNC